MDKMTDNGKVFVIGVDGATLELVKPWVDDDRLPGFARMMKAGVSGRLESTHNQRSAAAWTTLMTGKNPGKHGIYEFYEYVPGTYDIRFLNGSDRDAESLWGILSRNGKNVVVVNVPMTYPAEEVNGVLIAGLDAPGSDSDGLMYPAGLNAELKKNFGEYIIEPGVTGFIVAGKMDEALKTLYKELDQKFAVTEYLMDTRPWDFFMVVFRSLDAIQHCFWKFMDPTHPQYTEEGNKLYGNAIFDVYKRVDELLIKLLDRLGDKATIMIVSDHGFGKKHSATLALNDWLESKGYLRFASGDETAAKGSLKTRALAKAYKNIVGMTSRGLKEKIVRLFPGLRNTIQSRLIFSGIDWEHTTAYTDTLFPNIMINMKGREPLGVVDESGYDAIVERLRRDLKDDCRDAITSEPLVDKVFEKSEIYHGKNLYKAADILIRWREDIDIHTIGMGGGKKGRKKISPNYPLIPGEDPRIISGDHRLHGVFFMQGKGVKKGVPVDGANLIDFTSTVLYSMGCAIPDDIDGRVLTEAFEDEFIEKNSPRFESGRGYTPEGKGARHEYSDDDSEAVAARLRDLGYLE